VDGYISVLANKAGMAAEHFWPVLIQQQVIEGWWGIALFLILLIGFVSAFRLLFRNLPADITIEVSPKQFVCILVGAVVGVLLFIGMCLNLSDVGNNIARIKNPEYYAIKSLVDMVK
jgi:hypothetical protein